MEPDRIFKIVCIVELILVFLSGRCYQVHGYTSHVRKHNVSDPNLLKGGYRFFRHQNIRDATDGRSYLENSNGPCGELMMFYRHPDPEMRGDGYCDCFQKSYWSTDLGYLYDSTANRCYSEYSEGPCNTDEWYVLNPTALTPECRSNKCWQEVNRDRPAILFYNNMDNLCYENGRRGFCLNGAVIHADEKSHFSGISVGRATCLYRTYERETMHSTPLKHLKCQPGNRWSMMSGKCSVTAKSLRSERVR